MEENCELSDQNSHDLDIENPSYYDQSERHDYYQREASLGRAAAGCLDGEWRRSDGRLAGGALATATGATVSSGTGTRISWRAMTWTGRRAGICMGGRVVLGPAAGSTVTRVGLQASNPVATHAMPLAPD